MSDDLVVPDRHVVSLDEARAELDARKRPRPIGKTGDLISRGDVDDLLAGYVTRDDMVKLVTKINNGISEASLAVGQKVYDQIDEETGQKIEQMEHLVRQSVLAEMEARTLRGRIRARWLRVRDWIRDYGMELGAVDPVSRAPDLRAMTDALGRVPTMDEFSQSGSAFGIPHYADDEKAAKEPE